MPQIDKTHLFLSEKHLKILQDLLQQHVHFMEVWAYGSRVTGKAHSGSDLDLVLRGTGDISQQRQAVDDLKEALQDSMLPMLVDVHLWPDLPSSFYPNIEEAYVVIQEGKR